MLHTKHDHTWTNTKTSGVQSQNTAASTTQTGEIMTLTLDNSERP